MYDLRIFSPSLSFHSLNSVVCRANILNFDKVQFIYSFMDCALCLLALYRNIGFLYVKSQINKKQKNKFLPATIDYLQRVH